MNLERTPYRTELSIWKFTFGWYDWSWKDWAWFHEKKHNIWHLYMGRIAVHFNDDGVRG
jgi:hypothetical protein